MPLTIKFIFPVLGHLCDYNGYDVCNISSEELIEHQELLRCQMEDYGGGDMEQYFDENEDVKSKLKSIVWGFEEFGGRLYGVVTVELTDTIDEQGIENLKEWISGQNSDGLGEGFEQQCFDVDEGQLSVSLWDYNHYFIYSEEEFRQLQEEGFKNHD